MRLLSIILLLTIPQVHSLPAYAGNDCPFGLKDDPYPGRCRLYIDTNQDGLCDRSQEEPKARAETLATSAASDASLPSLSKNPVKNSPTTIGSSKKRPSSDRKPDAVKARLNTPPAAADSIPPKPAAEQSTRRRHRTWEILLAILVLSGATEIAIARRKSLYLILQTLWNWSLLLAFLGCAATGIYFLLPPSILQGSAVMISSWHTDTGLAFIAIGFYHAIRRFPCMLRGLKSCLH